VALRLYLIGDAGAPNPAGEPVLVALSRELRSGTGDHVVVYLGDNIYPRGLPPADAPGRQEAVRRISAQIEVVTKAHATGYFVLGNHDWERFGAGGWAAARRQDRFIDSVGAGRVSLQPDDGCPGPSVVDLGERLRLVLLDTQWWLHSGLKPRDPVSSCPADSESEVIDSLRSAILAANGRVVVVAAHHPLRTGGVHGGHFGWKDHLFPLQQVAPWAWLPLPLIGSLYPAARQNGISNQDLSSPLYQRMVQQFGRAFDAAPPALYAAGHEHNLQVIAGGPAHLELVSGGGIYGHNDRVVAINGTLFARQASGYARLDIPERGQARLAVLQVDSRGGSREVFSTWVE
jgi:Calcineurin-like phosphoesterase